MSIFKLGTKVTICTDAAFKHPRRTGFVKRIGNGAWRLNGCSEWYDFEGVRVAVDYARDAFKPYIHTKCFARPYQEGDEALIAIEDARVDKRAALLATKTYAESRIPNTRYALACAESAAAHAANVLASAESAVKQANKSVWDAKTKLTDLQATIARATSALEAFDAEQ